MTEKTDSPLLTIAELARTLGLPESTARYYCNRFAAHLPSEGEGRRRRYRPEAQKVLGVIAEAMRRDKNAYAVDLALQTGTAGVEEASPAFRAGGGLVAEGEAPSAAARMLALMEQQTDALRDIALAMKVFAEKATPALPASAQEPEADRGGLQKEMAALREQMRAAEAVHLNDLEQLRKWLTRLGEALGERK